ncbi:epoxide hydrolase family protein [Chitinophaga alhagiae]|uniref:epoxide hydrolase family protein n=1 Tax=Chitinophaga alhagiae TaxID=2203219 RepID=UPI000E5BCC27|nr:epoxide hydrolase family protein [Chitinophaga alhagiae]
MQTVTPFKIDVPQQMLEDLQQRLQRTRWADAPENAGWNYGTNPDYLKELVQYWATGYDWRKHEAALNQFPQFKAGIDGINIHFLHIRGTGQKPHPLLLVHGWPDSFYRYYKVIPMLTEYDLVIPSIPGFGFSDHVACDHDRTAGIFAKLMTDVLGYDTYYVAGGDLGTGIAKSMANIYPGAVKAIHLTDVGYGTGQEDWSQMSAPEQEFGQFLQHWWYTEGAYNMMHSTKPQTVAFGLNDSPAGLASWILEKFNAWTDNGGNIESAVTKDELITNIMIYWVTETINSSMRTYLENTRAIYTSGGLPQSYKRVAVPTGVASFPGEAPIPREWAERWVNVQRFTKMPKGGHFAALEVPEAWVGELKAFFEAV